MSRKDPDESKRLSKQAENALRDLLHGFQEADRAASRPVTSPSLVYEGLLTVILRLVFLLHAEDRELIPDNEGYCIGSLYRQLREDAQQSPGELGQRFGAYARLLKTFRRFFEAPHYGQLFDPDKYPFLEGRDSRDDGGAFEPPRISDSVILRVLERLLVLDGEVLSYRELGIEHLGSVYESLMEGGKRRSSGSHYTPRELTEPLVRTTLRPVLERLGEKPTPEQILDLKVCDPAMGSGAFLMEACRQLADAMVKAWKAHDRQSPDGDPLSHARRLIAQRCLYGVDKDPFAVNLAKLSLWLVTLAKDHAFTFLDHALKHGDSLVGLTREQIAAFHWKPNGPKAAGAENEQGDWIEDQLREDLEEALGWRGEIQALGEGDYDLRRAAWREAEDALHSARLIGDLCIAAFFGANKDKDREALRNVYRQKVDAWKRGEGDASELVGVVEELRAGERPVPPLHWEIEFPEVFGRDNAGFDAMMGNPPFLGGKLISSILFPSYERALKLLYSQSRGAADLVAYFFRRAFTLLRSGGTFGLLATNSISETATRRVGLDAILKTEGRIYEAWRSFDWPGSASVTVSRVHVQKESERASSVETRCLDGTIVDQITSSLTSAQDFSLAKKLARRVTYSEGTKLFGDAFVLPPSAVPEALAANPGLAIHIRVFVNGDVLNLTPRCDDGRRVVDFGEKEESQIAGCSQMLTQLGRLVTHERRNQTRQIHESRPWLHWDKRTRFFKEARQLPRIIACATPSRYLSFVFVDPQRLFTHSLKLFASASAALLATLQSRVHEVWVRAVSSSFGKSVRYTTSTSFDTFALPNDLDTSALVSAGETYSEHRETCLHALGVGPTELYRKFHSKTVLEPLIVTLRHLHQQMDKVVLQAYGWQDLEPVCDFRDGELGWPDATRDLVLNRLLALNQQRYAQEVAAGLHDKGKKKPTRNKSGAKKKTTKKAATAQGQLAGILGVSEPSEPGRNL